MGDYEDIRSDMKLIKRDVENLSSGIKDLVVAIKENTKEHHILSLSLKDINAKTDALDASCRRAHERMDKSDALKNTLIMGILSAIIMAVLGLVMKGSV